MHCKAHRKEICPMLGKGEGEGDEVMPHDLCEKKEVAKAHHVRAMFTQICDVFQIASII
jgi:hypothetical protein